MIPVQSGNNAKQNESAAMTAMGARVAGMASAVLFAKGATVIIAGLAFVIVSRILGPTTYGLYVLASSFAGILGTFSNPGISQALSKFVSEHKSSKNIHALSSVVSGGYLISGLIGLALMLGSIALSAPIASVVFGSVTYTYLIVYASMLILLVSLFAVATSALVGAGQGKDLVVSTLLQVLFQSGVSISLAILRYGASAPILGFAVGLFVGIAYATYKLYSGNNIRLHLPSRDAVLSLFGFLAPISAFAVFSGIVSSAANIILGKFSATSNVGNVGVAQKTAGIMSLATDSVSTALLPAIAAVPHNDENSRAGKIYNYSLYIAMVIFAPVAFYMVFMSHSISFVLFGPSYSLAPYYLAIVGVGIIFSILSDYTYALLIGRNAYSKRVSISAIGAVVLEVALLLATIPFFKGFGLLITVSLLTPLFTFAVYAYYARKMLKIEIRSARIGRVIAAAFISSIVIILPILIVRPSTIYGNLAVALGSVVIMLMFYPAVLAFTGAITAEDVKSVKEMSKGVPIAGVLLNRIVDYADGFLRL